jgi:hypothetical protein
MLMCTNNNILSVNGRKNRVLVLGLLKDNESLNKAKKICMPF